jgi:tetratricopeptide (TPR) repeat protein
MRTKLSKNSLLVGVAVVVYAVCVSPLVLKAQAPGATKPQCRGTAECNDQGTTAVKRKELGLAVRLFEAQVGYAEDAEDKSASLLAYNNLAAAYLKKKDFFRALAWAQVALQLDPENEPAKHNLRLIQNRVEGLKWPATSEGLYVQYAGRTQWNALCVRKTKGDMLQFHLLAYRMGSAWREYGAASYGDLEGVAVAGANGDFTFTGNEDIPACRVRMRFSLGSVQVEHEGDCEFGYGVDASGKYQRITARPPNLQACGASGMP